MCIRDRPHAAPTPGGPTIEVTYTAGEVIFEQDSAGDRIYEIVDGVIEITHDHPNGTSTVLATLSAGDQFGEMGPLFDLPRSATARAVGAVHVRAYTVEAFRSKFGGAHLNQLVARTNAGRDAMTE